MSFYRRNLLHYQSDYKPHFVTFVTKDRRVLPEWAREIVLASCLHGNDKKYSLYVAVVMPEHVHMILTPMIDNAHTRIFPLYEIMRALKSFSARAINQHLGAQGRIWQKESFDHVLRTSESLDAKIAYVMENPVRRGW